MKIALIILLALPLSLSAQMGRSPAFLGAAASRPTQAGPSSCDTVFATWELTNSSTVFGGAAGTEYIITRVLATNTATLCTIDLFISKADVDWSAQTIYTVIFADNSGVVGSLLSTSAGVAGASFSTEVGWQRLPQLTNSVNVVSNTYYYVGRRQDPYQLNRQWTWYRGNVGTGQTQSSADGTTWATNSTRHHAVRFVQ